MAQWDVFHSDRLELERSIDTAGVIERLGRGALTGDDLIRPAGSSEPWSRIGDRPALLEAAAAPAPAAPPSRKPEPEPEPAPEPEPPKSSALPPDLAVAPTLIGHEAGFPIDFDDLGDDEEVRFPSDPEVAAGRPAPPSDSYGEYDLKLRSGPPTLGPERSSVEVAVVAGDEVDDVFHGDGEPDLEEYDPLEEDEAVAEFTLSRGRAETVEELDLAAMVDVAFQLVLFFLVTATTVLYKTLEVPKPNPDANPPASAAQGRSRSLDDLKEDFILVEVDPGGSIKVDREPVPPDREALVARLREARERTNRQGLLLSADFTTPHRNAVLVYDAANEARLNIAIARPSRAESP